MDADKIKALLEQTLEAEFNFYQLDALCLRLSKLSDQDCKFVLNWISRLATTNISIAHQFANKAELALNKLDYQLIELWLVKALHAFDDFGVIQASQVIDNMDEFVIYGKQRQYAVFLVAQKSVLLHFVQGLSGRNLSIEESDSPTPYTDTQTLFLPKIVAQYDNTEDNFRLLKAMVVHLWAQIRFGTFHQDLDLSTRCYPSQKKALLLLGALENIRLNARIKKALPGVYRDIQFFESVSKLGIPFTVDTVKVLSTPSATIETSLALLEKIKHGTQVKLYDYQNHLRPKTVKDIQTKRIEKEKILIKTTLTELAQEVTPKTPPEQAQVGIDVKEQNEQLVFELSIEGEPVAPPDDLYDLFSSVLMDFSDIPPDYLVPAGVGQYDTAIYKENEDAKGVWLGTYHEVGAFIYPEWDFGRKHYKKDWCVVRELPVASGSLDFYHQTLKKHKAIVASLRRSFEAMRNENNWLKRQENGDEIDFNALIDTWNDWLSGSEMDNKLFMQKQKHQRNIAVMFMVDLSGSTKGWINDAEREALILMSESLELLDDRYAIYGFSGWSRKRCEVYKVKDFDQQYDDKIKGKICNIEPQKYTRMGAAIRHLTYKLNQIEAKTKILITLSDGKPDDYGMEYRGRYGIEDTHMALLEARRESIHPYCITIDSAGKDYLPQLYGDSSYTVIDQIEQLPVKIADIYRYLTA